LSRGLGGPGSKRRRPGAQAVPVSIGGNRAFAHSPLQFFGVAPPFGVQFTKKCGEKWAKLLSCPVTAKPAEGAPPLLIGKVGTLGC